MHGIWANPSGQLYSTVILNWSFEYQSPVIVSVYDPLNWPSGEYLNIPPLLLRVTSSRPPKPDFDLVLFPPAFTIKMKSSTITTTLSLLLGSALGLQYNDDSQLPKCGYVVQPCACPYGTTFGNSTTRALIGASANDVALVTGDCKTSMAPGTEIFGTTKGRYR